jgi:hypothetical protein
MRPCSLGMSTCLYNLKTQRFLLPFLIGFRLNGKLKRIAYFGLLIRANRKKIGYHVIKSGAITFILSGATIQDNSCVMNAWSIYYGYTVPILLAKCHQKCFISLLAVAGSCNISDLFLTCGLISK